MGIYKDLFKNKNFFSLWLGQFVSALGDRFTQMSLLAIFMIASQDSGEKMAWITFYMMLPFLLFGQVFGAVSDRLNRKKIMITADIVRAGLVLVIPFVSFGDNSFSVICLIIFAVGTLSALFSPNKMALIPNIVTKEKLLGANSLIASTGMIATLLGTLIAGFLIKWFGIKTSFIIDAGTFIVSAVMIANIFIKDKPSGQSQELLQAVQVKNLIEDIKAGLGFINRHQLIFRIVQLTAAYSLISSFFYISILNYSNSVLNLASDGYGVLLAGLGLGLSCGALLLGKKKGKLNYNHILMFGFILLTCMNFMFIFKPGFGLSLVVLFIGGLGAASILVVLDSLLQRSTPDSLRANVFGARGIVNNFVFLLSLLIVGKLIAHIQVGFIFGFLSFFSLLVAFLIYLYEGNFGYRLVKNFLRFVLKNFFELKVTGYENLPATSKVILAGNHTSLLDGVILMAAYPKRIYFMAAESVFKNNSWGLIARQLGFIPVKKETANKEAIREAVRILESRNAIGIFPEGRITKTEQMVEGKKGVAVIAKKTNTPIIPFAIEGAYYAWPNIKERIKRHPIEVHFGKPLDVSQFEVPQELVDVVMDEIKNIKIEAEKKGLIDVNPNVIVKHLINYE